MYFVDIFFCLFCNFRGSKPTRTQSQTEKNKEMALQRMTNTFLKKCFLQQRVHAPRNILGKMNSPMSPSDHLRN
jgi:hypothetical protein